MKPIELIKTSVMVERRIDSEEHLCNKRHPGIPRRDRNKKIQNSNLRASNNFSTFYDLYKFELSQCSNGVSNHFGFFKRFKKVDVASAAKTSRRAA